MRTLTKKLVNRLKTYISLKREIFRKRIDVKYGAHDSDSNAKTGNFYVEKQTNAIHSEYWIHKAIGALWLIVTLGTSVEVHAGLFGFDDMTWKEEVLLHDGSKIIVERHANFGGRREITQGAPVKNQSLIFSLPGRKQKVVWESEFDKDIGMASLNLLALHITNEIPYIVAEPNMCLAFNKWGRPNPPYIFFKYTENKWKEIPLSEFPIYFNEFNVAIEIKSPNLNAAIKNYGIVPSEIIKNLNDFQNPNAYESILREPIKKTHESCPEMIKIKTGWVGIGWFERRKNHESCVDYCNKEAVQYNNCPCERLFKEKVN